MAVNNKKEDEKKINNDLTEHLKEENSALLNDNNKLKLVILKIITQIKTYELDELKRDSEINVMLLYLYRNASRR
jgi:hypothetical protein